MRTWILAVTCVAGCGRIGFESSSAPGDAAVSADAFTPETVPPQVVNGSRLKAWYYTYESTSLFGGWTDTKLGVDCFMTNARVNGSSDEESCVPGGIASGNLVTFFALLYSDAACTKPSLGMYDSVRDGACQPPPPMFGHADGFFTVGARIASKPYLGVAGGSCSEYGPFPVQYALSTRVEPTAFVSLTGEERGTERLRLRTLVGADGSRQEDEIYDTLYDQFCALRLRPDHVVACERLETFEDALRDQNVNGLPSKIFADAACTVPAARSSASQAPTVIIDRQRAACAAETLEEYEVGAVLPAAWSDAGGQCTPINSPGLSFYSLGAHRRTIVPVTGTWSLSGSGRLRPVTVNIGGLTMSHGVWDELVGAQCLPGLDGATASWRCLPFTPGAGEAVHRLPDCSDPFVLGYPDCGQARWSAQTILVSPEPSCSAAGLSEVPSTLTSSGLFRVTKSGCVPVGEPLYVDGTIARPATDFVPLALKFPDGR